MTALISIPPSSLTEMRPDAAVGEQRGRTYCEQLEQGNILFFETSPLAITAEERDFLIRQRQSSARFHKNISYWYNKDHITGVAGESAGEQERIRAVMRAYAERVKELLEILLPDYAAAARFDVTSFRPQEEHGRKARIHARNDLLHVDSFPTRPTYGDRIMRVFTNVNPGAARIWITGETFEGLIERFSKTSEAPLLKAFASPRGPMQTLRASVEWMARQMKLPIRAHSPYDEFMHRFHNFLKDNSGYQEACPKTRWEFPPGCTWIVFTDMVSHAVLSGQFALEQTCFIPMRALAVPEKAPYSIVERLRAAPT